MEGLECKNFGVMSVTVMVFGRWELAVADNVYIRNGNKSNIGCRLSRCTDLQHLSVLKQSLHETLMLIKIKLATNTKGLFT